MLPRGRPRALGAAALLLLLLLIGFLLFGGDLECERGERGGKRRGPRSFPCPLTPRVSADGRPPAAGALDGDPSADRGGHNHSDCVPPPPPLPRCEVGERGPWRRKSQGRRAPSRTSRTPVGMATPGETPPGGSDIDQRAGDASPAPGLNLPFCEIGVESCSECPHHSLP